MTTERVHCAHGHEMTPENVIVRQSHGRSFRACRTCRNVAAREYRQTAAGVAARGRSHRLYRDKGGKEALKAVRRALQRGLMVKEPCRVCSNPDVAAHHPLGYGPHKLDVVWLCREHHEREHHTSALAATPTTPEPDPDGLQDDLRDLERLGDQI